MSKSQQNARFKKYESTSGDWHEPTKIKNYFSWAKEQAKRGMALMAPQIHLKLAKKSSPSGLYYEIFDLETRGNQFRVEVVPTDYAIDTKIYIDGKLVREVNGFYNFAPTDGRDFPVEAVMDEMPSAYVSHRSNPSGESIGGLLIAGLVGYAILKKSR